MYLDHKSFPTPRSCEERPVNVAHLRTPSAGQAVEVRMKFCIREQSGALNSMRSDFRNVQENLPFTLQAPAAAASALVSEQ